MRSPRPYGCRGPSYGRGPNADGYDRLTRLETDKTTWYPEPGAYLAAIRRARAILAAGGTIRMDWAGSPLNAEQFEEEIRAAIHRRINAKGGARYSRYNDPHERGVHIGFRRDLQALAAIKNRVCTHQFSTRAVHERFSNLLTPYHDF
jgi:pyoverdine/dityrosine biosynthesis protein Dit1